MLTLDTYLAGRRRTLADLLTSVQAGGCRRVTGPGGVGKSWLLAALGDEIVGAARWSVGLGPPPSEDPDGVLLVDDAELADEATLIELVGGHRAVVLAHRPVGGTAARLLDRLDRTPAVLGPLGHDESRELLAARWGERPSPVVTDELLTGSGGLPRWLEAVALDGPVSRAWCTPAVEEAVRAEGRRLSDPAARLLLATALLAGIDRAMLAAAAGLDGHELESGADELVTAGLAMDATPRLVPVVADALRRSSPVAAVAEIAERAATCELAVDDPSSVAERLVAVGATGPAIGRCLITAAHRLAAADPDRAEALLAAAQRAGAARADLACGTTVVAFHAGRTEECLAGLDVVLTADDGPVRADAVRAATGVLAARGGWERAARLAAGDPHTADLAALGFLAAGDLDALRTVAGVHPPGPEGLRAGVVRARLDGLLGTVADDPLPGMLRLLEAARLEDLAPDLVELPEPTAVIAAQVAALLGELDLAAETLRRPPRRTGTWRSRRQQLTSAWIAMRRGDWVGADEVVAALEAGRAWRQADPRDQSLADAVRCAVARRTGDLEAMLAGWRRARTGLLRLPPDLLQLPAITELLIAGSRLGDHRTVESVELRIDALLDRAGHPPLWALPCRWDQLHAAIARDDLVAARRAAERIQALPVPGPRVAPLHLAAPVWTDALGGEVDPGRVRQAAEALADAGMSWEAARLAGTAAIRCRDAQAMRSLLHLARSLPAPSSPSLVDPVGELSGREQEVATHLLAGLTYRQIGQQLFIAPKTVEHHVARIRRKLGVSTREELLLALRRHRPVGGEPEGA